MRCAETVEKNRGRVERRELTATTRGVDGVRWPGLGQFLKLVRRTTVAGETRETTSYAITSLPPERASPEALLSMWRGRWEIENRAFHVLDVTLREDHSRIRTGRSAETMGMVRIAAYNHARAHEVDSLPAALRQNALNVEHLLHELGILDQ